MGPLGVDLSLEIKRLASVGDISEGDEECEEDPEHECVCGEEGAIVDKVEKMSSWQLPISTTSAWV